MVEGGVEKYPLQAPALFVPSESAACGGASAARDGGKDEGYCRWGRGGTKESENKFIIVSVPRKADIPRVEESAARI